MDEIVWIENANSKYGKYVVDCVEVRKISENGKDKIAIIFFNGSEKKITDSNTIITGMRGDRIYIDEAGLKGYTLRKWGNQKAIAMNNLLFEPWAGVHKLKYDDAIEMYYIDKEVVDD